MKTAFALMLLLLSSTALALEGGRESSEVLLKRCIEAEKVLNGIELRDELQGHMADTCIDYVDGFRDGLDTARTRRICIPKDVTTGQLIRVVLKYLRENPSKLHLDESRGVEVALQGAYPCR